MELFLSGAFFRGARDKVLKKLTMPDKLELSSSIVI